LNSADDVFVDDDMADVAAGAVDCCCCDDVERGAGLLRDEAEWLMFLRDDMLLPMLMCFSSIFDSFCLVNVSLYFFFKFFFP
jgi:hypothetical protein